MAGAGRVFESKLVITHSSPAPIDMYFFTGDGVLEKAGAGAFLETI